MKKQSIDCEHKKGLQLSFGNASVEWCPECGALAVPTGMGKTVNAINDVFSRHNFAKGAYAFVDGLGSCRRFLPKRLSESR